MRHEGWHADQDCMAGTIDNSMIGIIKPEEGSFDLACGGEEHIQKLSLESRVVGGRTEGMTQAASLWRALCGLTTYSND